MILGEGLSEKLKKKRIITQQYFSFHLINKYNKDIDNIFIVDFKSVFMAHSKSTNYIRLSSSPQVQSLTDGVFASVDLSAFVDPLHSLAFHIVRADIELTQADPPYGLIDSVTVTGGTAIGMQIATGAQTEMLRPNDGKVIFHKFALYVNETGTQGMASWNEETFYVDTLWPNGYVAVVDNLTAMLQGTAVLDSADFRMTYTITGYQKKVSANQLASLLVAQTQS